MKPYAKVSLDRYCGPISQRNFDRYFGRGGKRNGKNQRDHSVISLQHREARRSARQELAFEIRSEKFPPTVEVEDHVKFGYCDCSDCACSQYDYDFEPDWDYYDRFDKEDSYQLDCEAEDDRNYGYDMLDIDEYDWALEQRNGESIQLDDWDLDRSLSWSEEKAWEKESLLNPRTEFQRLFMEMRLWEDYMISQDNEYRKAWEDYDWYSEHEALDNYEETGELEAI